MTVVAFVLLVVGVVMQAVNAEFRLMQKSVPRKGFVLRSKAEQDAVHELVFAVAQKNLKELDSMLLERSTPGSPLYQQWLTFEEVGNFTSNREGAAAVVHWLAENDIQTNWQSAHADYIKASAPIAKWEQLLQASFSAFEDLSRGAGSTFYRAAEYSLPVEVLPYLSAVFNTVQVPPALESGEPTQLRKNPTSQHLRHRNKQRERVQSDPQSVTIDFLNDLYNISTNKGDPEQQQAVFQTADEHFSPLDLTQFQMTYGVKIQAAEDPSNRATSDCVTNSCGEGNLDLQYIMGLSQGTETIFWHVDADTDPFLSWITDVADMVDPPRVHSISWGSIEQGRTKDTLDAFDTEALKLSVMGVTILVASGDNGATAIELYCGIASGYGDWNQYWTGTPWAGQSYYPSFPATSPYVTAVGATMGPETGGPEVACQSQLGGVITSGGGFSTYYPAPAWQTDAVAGYFTGLAADQQPTPGYNPGGRAYPDVSMIGVWYDVVQQGDVTAVFGTSASTPVFAAMISLINAKRARQGLPSVGFLNPSLYASASAFRDVSSGHNKCTVYGDINDPSGAFCCESGFHSTAGWDPVTGLGSISFDALEVMFAGGSDVADDDNSSSGSKPFSTGAIIGIAIGGAALLLIGATVVLVMEGVLVLPSYSSASASVVPFNDTAGAAGTAGAGGTSGAAGVSAAPDIMDEPISDAVSVKAGAQSSSARVAPENP